MPSLKTCAIGIGMFKNLHTWRIKPFWLFLPSQNSIYFFHSISFWKTYLFLKIHKVVFDQEELLKITWESLSVGFWACWLQWWWSEVCLTKSLRDKFCILLNNGNFGKITLIFGFLHIFPSYPFLLPSPDEIWSLSKKCPWPSNKKNVHEVVLWWAVSTLIHTYSP